MKLISYLTIKLYLQSCFTSPTSPIELQSSPRSISIYISQESLSTHLTHEERGWGGGMGTTLTRSLNPMRQSWTKNVFWLQKELTLQIRKRRTCLQAWSAHTSWLDVCPELIYLISWFSFHKMPTITTFAVRVLQRNTTKLIGQRRTASPNAQVRSEDWKLRQDFCNFWGRIPSSPRNLSFALEVFKWL